jgi:hypothetical protein
MTDQLFCQKHGPYDAFYVTCPYCSGAYKRPPQPKPLSEDDLPTDLGAGNQEIMGSEDLPTDLKYRGGLFDQRDSDEDAPTEIGPRRRSHGKFLDDEETTLGDHWREDDGTKIYEDYKPVGMMGILWMKEGGRRGKIYKLQDGAVVARTHGDLRLDDDYVSDPHARFVIEENQFVLWDFGSKNGTFVNGERIRAATPLQENDIIKIGLSTFVLKILEE